MNYSEEFKAKFKEVYKDNESMLKCLEMSDQFIGQYLRDELLTVISAEEVVAAYENDFFEDLYKKAKRHLLIEQLYEEWSDMYHEYVTQNSIKRSSR